MMAKAPKDEFGTPFGQAGSAAATRLGTPFGQASSTTKKTTSLEPTVTIGGAPAGYRPATKEPETPVLPTVPQATGIPSINDRSKEPGPARKGYRWRWVSMAKVNNPYGGEWREEWAGGVQDSGGGDTNKNDNATQDFLLAEQRRAQAEADRRDRQSAYDILYNEFSKYGLSSLVEDIKYLIQSNVSPSQFSLELQNTKAYKERFKANEARIAAGLSALRPAEYVALEDQYQNVMRNYGLPATYYTKDATGRQVGFEKFIAGDVSATELEDRISTAQKRVINANPEVSAALKAFYPDINNGDILAYVLDPSQGLEAIKRKVTAAEIGGAAMAQNLSTSAARAMELAGYGVTKEQAQQGFQAVAGVVPRGSQLAEIYGQSPYGQTEAEQEVFGLAGSEAASARRKKLVGLERASFSGTSGAAQGALGRERAMGQGQI